MKEFRQFLALTLIFGVVGISIFSGLGLRQRSLEVCVESDQDAYFYWEFKENFDCWLEAEWKKWGPPGMAVAVISEGQLVYGKSFGVVGLGRTEKIDFNTTFRLASVSKTFAGVLTAIMVKEGSLDWEDKVVYYLPEFRLKDSTATHELKVKHLLSHTTGLPRHAYSNMLDNGVPYQKLKELLGNLQLNTSPGQEYNYQNVAFSLIGDVLEVATGKKYEDLLQDKLFTPLGMNGAGSGYNHLTNLENKAYPHYFQFGKYKNRNIESKYFDVGPAAGVNASIEDMIKYARLMTGYYPDILGEESVEQLFFPQVEVSKKESSVIGWQPIEKAWYGLGWRGVQKNQRKIIFHGGFVNGYRSEIALIPEEKLALVVLTNAPNPIISEIGSNFIDFWDAQLVKQ
jgi:beta-lactamase class C